MQKEGQKVATVKKESLSRSALRRQRDREHRYKTILKAAERLFASEGYHKASMEEIADAAEVSTGAVYFYFKNKEDLLIQLLDEFAFQLRTFLGTEFQKAGASLAGFEKTGRAYFEEFCVRHPEKVAIFLRESVGQGPLVEKQRRKISDELTSDLMSALRLISENLGYDFQGKMSAEVIAVSIMGIYERVAYQYLLSQDHSKDIAIVGHDAVAFILGGVKNLFRESTRA